MGPTNGCFERVFVLLFLALLLFLPYSVKIIEVNSHSIRPARGVARMGRERVRVSVVEYDLLERYFVGFA